MDARSYMPADGESARPSPTILGELLDNWRNELAGWAIPEEITVDLTGLDVGDTVRAADLVLPEGVTVHAHHQDATVASISTSSAMTSAEEETAE